MYGLIELTLWLLRAFVTVSNKKALLIKAAAAAAVIGNY